MTSFRPYHAIAGACLAAVFVPSGMAQAQSWNQYNSFASLPTVNFVNGPMNFLSEGAFATRDASIYLSLSGGTASNGTANPLITQKYVMDTGSTGIIATPDNFQPGPNDKFVGTGSQYYDSSGVRLNGNFYLTNVVINNGSTTPLATSQVTVLQVTSSTCDFTSKGCVPNPAPTGAAYMGVGFDRGVSAIAPSAPYNNTNPFTNIVSLASGQPVSSLAPGYLITNSGVTLGLGPTANSGFAFVKLSPNPTGVGPEAIWNQAPVTITTGGATGSGQILPDSGIGYSFLTPPSGAVLTTGACSIGGTGCIVPGTGAEVHIFLPGQSTPQPASYSFAVNTPVDSPLNPQTVQVVGGSTVFINTGREFYSGFDYIYDPVGGYVGYRWNGNVSGAFGQVTPGVSWTGSVNLQNGFASSLPTFLLGPTTLMQTGTGTISSVVAGSGGLTIGSGQVNLTGVNVYTGGTTVSSGATLGIGADSGLGAASGALVLNGGTLLASASFGSARTVSLGSGGGTFDTNGNNLGITTGIAGTGGLTKTGTGTMTLGGASTYTGGTTVNGGTLRMAAGASLASTGALNIVSGIFDLNGNNMTIGPLSGTSGTLALGSGIMPMSGLCRCRIASC